MTKSLNSQDVHEDPVVKRDGDYHARLVLVVIEHDQAREEQGEKRKKGTAATVAVRGDNAADADAHARHR